MIKVMIADDHMIVREGIKKILEKKEIEIVAEASNGEECLAKLEMFCPDILISDIHMPEKSGIEILKVAKERKLPVSIFLITAYTDIDDIVEAVDLGVNGYALKNIDQEELIKGLYEIADGKQYIQTSLIPKLNNKLLMQNEDKDKIQSLTRREMDMLKQIASGMSNKEIASTFDITERTVKNHISSLFKKIGVSDRTQAAVFAIKNNLITI